MKFAAQPTTEKRPKKKQKNGSRGFFLSVHKTRSKKHAQTPIPAHVLFKPVQRKGVSKIERSDPALQFTPPQGLGDRMTWINLEVECAAICTLIPTLGLSAVFYRSLCVETIYPKKEKKKINLSKQAGNIADSPPSSAGLHAYQVRRAE